MPRRCTREAWRRKIATETVKRGLQTSKRRPLVSLFFAILIAGLFFGYSDMLGLPKSTRLELRRSGDYMIEGSGIYLWLLLPGAGEPRYYVLSWDQKNANALQKAIEDNAQSHGGGNGRCSAIDGRTREECYLSREFLVIRGMSVHNGSRRFTVLDSVRYAT